MRLLKLLAVLLLSPVGSYAGTISGQIQTSTGGVQANGTLNFTLSQPAVLSGTATIVTSTTACYTSNAGNVVGVPDPQSAPSLSANYGAGTLAAATYYVVITYAGAGGESVASPETVFTMTGAGTLLVNAPSVQPSSATGFKVYIGSTPGSEKLQGTVTGWTQFSQSTSLLSVTAPPGSNSSACSLYFSDQLIPTGTFYTVNFLNSHGSQLSGFPQTWCTFGGQSGTINISNGAPTGNCGTQGVFYPTPIVAAPQNNAQQSISGPLSVTGEVQTTGTNSFTQTKQAGFPVNFPTSLGIFNTTSSNYFSAPDVYIGRTDSTSYGGSCFSGPLAACDQPIVHITGTNTTTGTIPGMVGLEVDLFGFKPNTGSPAAAADYEVGLGSQVQDAATPNVAALRGANLIVDVNGLPTLEGPAGVTRSAFGAEVDINNSTGADAVFSSASGGGNYVGGISMVAIGANSSTVGLSIGSSASANKGWLSGIDLYGAVNCGVCLFNGGNGNFAPTVGFDVSSTSAWGFKAGSGTVVNPTNSAETSGNPTVGFFLDAKGVAGQASAQDSNILQWRTKDNASTFHDFKLQSVQSINSLVITIDGNNNLRFGKNAQCLRMLNDAGNTLLNLDCATTATSFQNGGSVAGYSDAGSTQQWFISNLNGTSNWLGMATMPALALKNSNALTITPNSIAAGRAVSVNDPLNTAVLPLYITTADNTVDLASVASGACTSERTVAVTGARFGDDVRVMAGTALEAGTFLVGKVSSADNTKWQFCNLSGGAVDRASDSYTIRVTK